MIRAYADACFTLGAINGAFWFTVETFNGHVMWAVFHLLTAIVTGRGWLKMATL